MQHEGNANGVGKEAPSNAFNVIESIVFRPILMLTGQRPVFIVMSIQFAPPKGWQGEQISSSNNLST